MHIHDQAGVACILAKYQRMNDIKSKVLSSNTIDKYGILKFYKDYVDIIDRANFVEYCLAEAKSADIIHIHSVEQLVIKIRKVFGNSKRIILHYHGTDIRGLKNKNTPHSFTIQNTKTRTKSYAAKVKNRLRLIQMGYYRSLRTESQKLANEILVSTPDLLLLLPYAKYLPNPVDVDHFSKDDTIHNKVNNNNNALTIKTTSGDIQKTLLYCKENNINLKIDVLDRTTTPILYEEIPNFLKKYNIYIDIRIVNDKILENFSKTALESLSCGLKVLNYKLEYIDRLPSIHNPVNVTKELENIYNKI
ncbi:MAG: hypothetical protein QOK72_05845 [Nitrososphaeraceae archaeon]|nr:hypothetical protein [Nitrososphaeraceae archaeon]